MNFNIEEILKNIIPGAVIVIALSLCYGIIDKLIIYKDLSAIVFTVFLLITYLVGHINDAISSWLEDVVFYVFRRPSLTLMKNKAKRFPMPNNKEIFDALKVNMEFSSLITLKNIEARKLLQIAKVKAFGKSTETNSNRLHAFYKAYLFSRNCTISILLSSGIYYQIIPIESSITRVVILLTLFSVLLYRTRDRLYYYSREILTSVLD